MKVYLRERLGAAKARFHKEKRRLHENAQTHIHASLLKKLAVIGSAAAVFYLFGLVLTHEYGPAYLTDAFDDALAAIIIAGDSLKTAAAGITDWFRSGEFKSLTLLLNEWAAPTITTIASAAFSYLCLAGHLPPTEHMAGISYAIMRMIQIIVGLAVLAFFVIGRAWYINGVEAYVVNFMAHTLGHTCP